MADEKYRTQLTGAQVDDALQQLNQRVAEGWAVGTRDGSPVGSGTEYYHNNAKYWAEQSHSSVDAAEAAAERAEAAVPAGTAGAVFFDREQSLTDTQKEQARKNVGAGGTNPNLLDNPFFTIRQRGDGPFTSEGTTLDRWKIVNGCTVTGTANGMRFQASQTYRSVRQVLETPSNYANGTYTVSINLVDATAPNYLIVYDGNNAELMRVGIAAQTGIQSWTFTSGATGISAILFDNLTLSTVDFTIRAVKLERGTVSTLANDTPPDYGEELTRCIYSTADPADNYSNNGFGRTNPNLLDNPWFGSGEVINQRFATSGTQANNAYFIDRWFWSYSAGAGTWSLGSTGLTFNSNASGYTWLMQKMTNPSIIDGKTITASIMLSDGTIHKGTDKRIGGTNQGYINIGGGAIYVAFNASNQFYVRVYGSTNVTIRAVKLELGTISTLANDTPPDYGTELAKCQRQLLVLTDPQPLGSGYFVGSGNNAYIFVPTPVTMRAKPTITGGAYYIRWQKADGTMNSVTSTTVNVASIQPNGIVLNITGTGVSAIPCVAYATGTIILSAEL